MILTEYRQKAGKFMKKLNQFTFFDWNSFAKGKKFVSIGCKEWKNYDTGEHLGTKIDAVIAVDQTSYGNQANEIVTNLYEKLTFKVPKDIAVPLNVEIQPKGVVATVYGDYRNLLSCMAEDIIVADKG